MKAILTLVAVAFTAMVSNIVQAEGTGQPPPPSAQSPGTASGGQDAAGQSGQSGKSGAQGSSGASSSGAGSEPAPKPKVEGGATKPQGDAAPSPRSEQVAPDNTGSNKERDQGKPEAQDQSNESSDLELTASLRRAITEDESLSVNAHNIKIITQGNKVTLRGPVDSQAEKDKVEALARKAAAGRQVTNELEVKAGGKQQQQKP